jgi:hypothetical protein
VSLELFLYTILETIVLRKLKMTDKTAPKFPATISWFQILQIQANSFLTDDLLRMSLVVT